jgi:D-alanyl-D-alanine carboxypeptidase
MTSSKKKEPPRVIKVLRIIMPLVGLAVAILTAPLDLVPLMLRPLPASVQEQADDAIAMGLDGIIVYVDRAGAEPAFYSSGVRNAFTRAPADPGDYFKIGSIHKLYIAAAVAMLVDAGTLSLDDNLAKLLPSAAGRIEHADEISLRMLVRHRSGIPNFTDQDGFNWFAPEIPREDALDLILDLPARFEPDSRYEYSNSNYLILGFILDEALGYSHQQYVYDNILAPLGLRHTFFSIDEVDFADVMSGYWYGYDDDLRSLGGSMIATAEDVGKFLRALNDGSLFSDSEQEIYSSIYEYGHDGWVPGYHSKARYYEDIDTVVVQFVSTTGGATWGVAEVTGGKATALSNMVRNRIVRILRRQRGP